MFLVSACSCLCAIYLSQVLSGEWRCSWSNADRRCSNYIWVINNLIPYWGASYIIDLTVLIVRLYKQRQKSSWHQNSLRFFYEYHNSSNDKWKIVLEQNLKYNAYSWYLYICHRLSAIDYHIIGYHRLGHRQNIMLVFGVCNGQQNGLVWCLVVRKVCFGLVYMRVMRSWGSSH